MANAEVPKNKFTKHSFDKHRKLLSEIPQSIATRQQNSYNRHQMIAGTPAYNVRLKKQRVQSHLSDFAALSRKRWPNTRWATLTAESTS